MLQHERIVMLMASNALVEDQVDGRRIAVEAIAARCNDVRQSVGFTTPYDQRAVQCIRNALRRCIVAPSPAAHGVGPACEGAADVANEEPVIFSCVVLCILNCSQSKSAVCSFAICRLQSH